MTIASCTAWATVTVSTAVICLVSLILPLESSEKPFSCMAVLVSVTLIRFASWPASRNARLDFWLPKLERNRERDELNIDRLLAMGWSVLIVWECELKNTASLSSKIRAFLTQ